MKRTDYSLTEQLRITELEIQNRKALFAITSRDVELLHSAKGIIEGQLDRLVSEFYEHQTSIPEIALVIGDADTLSRLKTAQRHYIIDLFSGFYDMEYVNNRLRIGLVHKRIGVEPKLYLAAIQTLKTLVYTILEQGVDNESRLIDIKSAVEKIFMFDISLVFDTYIRSLISEIEISKEKSENYAKELEEKVQERTNQLEIMSRTDALTGLLNVRHLKDILNQSIKSAQRRAEALTVVFFDIDDFKAINDQYGHQKGDEILRAIADAVRKVSRSDDHCFRYGGDEFCIIMPNCSELHAKEIYGARLFKELKKNEQDVQLSIGYVQTGPEKYEAPDDLIHTADSRMYAAKKQNKGDRSIVNLHK